MPDDPIIIATNANYSTGSYSGQPTKIAPDSGLLANGYAPKTAPTPEQFNAILNNHGQNLAYLRRPVVAWLSLANTLTAYASPFGLTLKSSYYRDVSWSVLSDIVVQVPEIGLYRVDFIGLIDEAPDSNYVEVAIGVGPSFVGFSVVGYAMGGRFGDGDDAAPARVVGSCIVPILDPAAERFAFLPSSGTSQTPEAEASVGRAHQIIITKIGDLSP